MKNSRCIEGTSILRDAVELFDKEFNKNLNDSKCESSSFAKDPKSGLAPVMSSLNSLDIAMNELNHGKVFDHVRSLDFKHA